MNDFKINESPRPDLITNKSLENLTVQKDEAGTITMAQSCNYTPDKRYNKTDSNIVQDLKSSFCIEIRPDNASERNSGNKRNISNSQSRAGFNQRRYFVFFQTNGSLPPEDSTIFQYDPSRNSFVMKVMIYVVIMLIITALFNITVYITFLRSLFRELGLLIIIPAIIVQLSVSYAFSCSSCTRRSPCNIIMLVLTTVAMSLMTAYFTSWYKTHVITGAVAATTVTVFVCIILACTKFDFTKYMIYIVMISVALGVASVVIVLMMQLMGIYLKPLHITLLILGTVVNSVVMTMELQMIIGGRSVELAEDEYAFGAFMIYTSIIDLFIRFMALMRSAE